MLRRIQSIGAAIAATAAGGTAFAHPGHGVIPSDEPAHWLEPVHFVPIVIVGLGVAAYAWRRARRGT
jgi:hypothetical protein